jgi:hypothetical protein
MRIQTFAALAAMGCALSGCATIVKGTSQDVAIATPPISGAMCILSSGEGSWTVISPGMARVERSKEDMQIRCNKDGYQEAVSTIPSNIEGWTAGNLLVGGAVGFGVDAVSGAINEYPHTFQVPMFPVTAAK